MEPMILTSKTYDGISLESVSFSRNGTPILNRLTLKIGRGEMIGLIGPNGAGKSTLLKLLIKLITPSSGDLHFETKPLKEWKQRELIHRIAYLPQDPMLESGFTCLEVVLMGRYARRGRFEGLSAQDQSAANKAMQQTETAPFAARLFSSLSGGERQRVLLARALAQEADFFLFDEPTASLDLQHQLHFFQLITARVKEGLTVLLAIHDLNLAARFCKRLILLHQGLLIADGSPETVLTPAHLQSVYGVTAEIGSHPKTNTLSVLPLSIDTRASAQEGSVAPHV